MPPSFNLSSTNQPSKPSTSRWTKQLTSLEKCLLHDRHSLWGSPPPAPPSASALPPRHHVIVWSKDFGDCPSFGQCSLEQYASIPFSLTFRDVCQLAVRQPKIPTCVGSGRHRGQNLAPHPNLTEFVHFWVGDAAFISEVDESHCYVSRKFVSDSNDLCFLDSIGLYLVSKEKLESYHDTWQLRQRCFNCIGWDVRTSPDDEILVPS